MATFRLEVNSVSLSSSWTIIKTDVNEYEYSTPNTAYSTRTFNLSGIPSGATINSATLSCTRWGSGAIRTMDGTNADSKSIATSRITPGGNLEITFAYKATASGTVGGNIGAQTTKTASAGWNNPTLTVEYTEPYSAVSAPTTVSVSKTNASPSESITLSWSGASGGTNTSIASYTIYRSTSLTGTYSVLASGVTGTSRSVSAPSTLGSYYYKILSVSSPSGYNSGLSSAYAVITVAESAPTAPTTVSAPSSGYPSQDITLSWSGAAHGANNNITGYSIYRKIGSGSWIYYKGISSSTTSGSTTVTIDSAQTTYFAVAALGTKTDSSSGMSTVYSTTTINASTTSDFTLSPIPVNAGSQITLTMTSNTASAHTATFSFASYTANVNIAAGTGTYAYTIPLAWLNAIPNTTSGTASVTLATTGGGKYTKTFTVTCPDSAAPTLSGSITKNNSNSTIAGWGIALQGYTTATVKITAATPKYSASIVSYNIVGEGLNKTSTTLSEAAATTGTLGNSGTRSFTLSVTDSRGKIGSTTLSLVVEPYATPYLTSITARRCNSDGAANPEGTSIQARSYFNYSSCEGNNSVTCTASTRKAGDTAWSGSTAMVDGTFTIVGTNGYPIANDYEVRLTITDALNSTNVTTLVPKAHPEFNIARGGGAWGVGGMADNPGYLKVYGGLHVTEQTYLAKPLTLGTPLYITEGGTGASTRAGAAYGMLLLEDNVINTENDTTQNWANIGPGYSFYGTGGTLTDKPGSYGFVINYPGNYNDIFQFWNTTPGGGLFIRGGNHSGWHSTWRKIYDSGDTIPISNGGTGATTASGARDNLQIATNMIAKATYQYSSLYFQNSRGQDTAAILLNNGNSTTQSNSQMTLREFSYNGTDALSYYESYNLPTCTWGRTSNAIFNILTTKNTVTIAQGGTGSTTAAGARTNLGIPTFTYNSSTQTLAITT